jgi:hypothetical protein
MKKPINIRIDPKLLEKIRAKSKEERRSVTSLIEYVMDQYCDGKL